MANPKTIKTRFLKRTFSVDTSKIDTAKRTFELSFSSEIPILTQGFVEDSWQTFYEILDHTPSSVDMTRINDGAPFLVNHCDDDLAGIVASASIDPDRIGRAIVRASQSEMGQEIFQDIQDGIRPKVSVGYIVKEYRAEGLNSEDQIPIYRAMSWMPLEISSVPLPADNFVGVGRSEKFEREYEAKITTTEPEAVKGDSSTVRAVVEEKKTAEAEKPQVKVDEETKSGTVLENKEVKPAAIEQKNLAQNIQLRGMKMADLTAEQERARIEGINAIVEKYGQRDASIKDESKKAIATGEDVNAFGMRMLEKVGAVKKVETETRADLASGFNFKAEDVQGWSLHRAINCLVNNRFDGVEGEMHRELNKRFQVGQGEIYVPFQVLNKRAYRAMKHRSVMETAPGSAGGYTVGTQIMPGMFVEYLYNTTAALPLVTELTGLQQNISIPKMTGNVTYYWVGEGVNPTQSANTFGQINMSPKNLACQAEVSKNLLTQSTPDVEQITMMDLARSFGVAIDLAILNGAGGSAPTGILNTAGIINQSGATATYTTAVNYKTLVAKQNAFFNDSQFIGSATVEGVLASRLVNPSGYGDEHILEDGKIYGRPFSTSTNLDNNSQANTILFGSFETVVLGTWGPGFTIRLNPFGPNAAAGNIQIYGNVLADVAVRYPQAFSYSTDLT